MGSGEGRGVVGSGEWGVGGGEGRVVGIVLGEMLKHEGESDLEVWKEEYLDQMTRTPYQRRIVYCEV